MSLFAQQNMVHRVTFNHQSIYPAIVAEGGGYLWEMSPSHHNTVGGSLQNLPHTIIKAQRRPVQRAIDLTPIQPGPEAK